MVISYKLLLMQKCLKKLLLNKVNLSFKGSTGGHIGAAGMKGVGDGEALVEMVKQECVKKIKEG